MKQLFLPLGLILAVVAALIFPEGGNFIADNYGLKIFVCLIFLVTGYQTGSKALSLNKNLGTLFLVAALISLAFAPLLALIVSKTLNLPLQLATGLIIISTVPPTISSGIVITEVSRGNSVLALFLTISLNLLGIFTMPFVLDLCLKATGPIDIDQTALLLKMVFFVLIPFAIGKMVRNVSNKEQISPIWSYVNSGCVILIVYSSLSTSKAAFAGLTLSDYTVILAAVAAVHLLLLAGSGQAAKMMKLSSADSKAVIFVTSQKTMALALAVLANVQFETGSAIIVCLMFHFFQLFLDSFLASIIQKK